MQLSFENRVFVVTGAAQGIGRAIVAALAEAGATVAAIDIDADGLRCVADRAATHVADLGSRDGTHAAMAEIEARHGRIDGLVTAATARLDVRSRMSPKMTGMSYSPPTSMPRCGARRLLHRE